MTSSDESDLMAEVERLDGIRQEQARLLVAARAKLAGAFLVGVFCGVLVALFVASAFTGFALVTTGLDAGPSPRRSPMHVSGRGAARAPGSGGDSGPRPANGGPR